MSPPLADANSVDLERFRAAIVQRMGLYFDENKTGFLAEVLQRRIAAQRSSSAAYLDELESGRTSLEIEQLAAELTVPETYFFRNQAQFDALTDVTLRGRGRGLRILSAGCASGEEPYTLAILLRESLGDAAANSTVRAVDLNPLVLEKARRGQYSAWALRETPPELQRRWFSRNGSVFTLDDRIRGAVAFEAGNLVRPDADLFRPEAYDVVFCRNVLMYFTPELARAVMERVTRSLAPGGYLFLGHAETLRGLSRDYALCHTHGTFYYQRRSEIGASGRPAVSPRPEAGAVALDPPALLGDADTWLEAIQRAHQRIQTLAEGRQQAPETAARAPAHAPQSTQLALELLRQERFADALEMISAAPADSVRDADVLLLEAALLTHAGRFAEAERVCSRLLERDGLCAGAYYLLALCSESAGDRGRAMEQDRVAAYLDAAFAMPRLHMGLLARRAGDRELARRELALAQMLLGREDASRLLLFGGGFGRDSLIQLCGAELAACGGAP